MSLKQDQSSSFLLRELISFLLALQIVIAALGAVVYGLDHATGSKIANRISGGDDAVGLYYLCGTLAFLALLGLFTLVGACCYGCECTGIDNTGDDLCCAYYCCWWGDHCNPAWYYSPGYYGHGASCGAPEFRPCGPGDCNGCGGCDCGGCDCGGDQSEAVLIILLVIVIILAIIGFFVLMYILIIVGQRLFQRHVEILSRREVCRQQEVVDLSEIDPDDVDKYAVVDVEPSAPSEKDMPNMATPIATAPPKDIMEGSEPLFGVGDRSDSPLLK